MKKLLHMGQTRRVSWTPTPAPTQLSLVTHSSHPGPSLSSPCSIHAKAGRRQQSPGQTTEAQRDGSSQCRPLLLLPKLICTALGPPGHPHATSLGQSCTYGSMLTGVASPITDRTGGVTSELSMGKEHIGKWLLPPCRKALPS